MLGLRWLSWPKRTGRFVRRIFVTNAGTRFYKLYIPSRYRGQSLPLLVMLHGCKQSSDDFAAGTGMNKLADELEFLVVYPAQAWTANYSRCWNWFRPRDQKRDDGEPSLIAGITKQVIERYNADARRVYIAPELLGQVVPGIGTQQMLAGLPLILQSRDHPAGQQRQRGGGQRHGPHHLDQRVSAAAWHGSVCTFRSIPPGCQLDFPGCPAVAALPLDLHAHLDRFWLAPGLLRHDP